MKINEQNIKMMNENGVIWRQFNLFLCQRNKVIYSICSVYNICLHISMYSTIFYEI